MRNYSGQLPNETSENYLKKFKASVNCPKSEWHMNKPLFKNIYKHLIKKKKSECVVFSSISSTVIWRFHSRLVLPRTQGSLYPQHLEGELSSQEESEFFPLSQVSKAKSQASEIEK